MPQPRPQRYEVNLATRNLDQPLRSFFGRFSGLAGPQEAVSQTALVNVVAGDPGHWVVADRDGALGGASAGGGCVVSGTYADHS
jgi:hypothetical protein